MELSVKILDPDSTGLTDIGHFLFLGDEDSKKFRAQIIDLDDDGNAYYIALSSSVDIIFPVGVSLDSNIATNRSIVYLTIDNSALSTITSGDLSILIHEPTSEKIANLGRCIRRILPLDIEDPLPGTNDGTVKTNADDDTASYLETEIQAGSGISTEVIDDPTYGKVIKISTEAQFETLLNNSGSQILAGRIVRANTGGIVYANNLSLINANALGITLEDINDSESGNVATDGTIDLLVAGASDGDTLYIDNSLGNITNVPPSTPGTVVFKIGRYNLGKIYIDFELFGVN